MDGLANPSRALADLILPLYRDTTFAYGLATMMAIVALILVLAAIFVHVIRMGQIRRREAAIVSEMPGLSEAITSDGSIPAEKQFSEDFVRIDNVLSQSPYLASGLALAWRQYRKTLSQTPSGIYQSPYRPRSFFFPALRPAGSLDFSANIFVAFGLLATFVGLVAALTFAAAGMENGDPGAMQAAVTDLLGASSSKFVTSIAGVGLSIVLRVADRILTRRQQAALARLCDSIEAGIRVDPGAASATRQGMAIAS